MSKEEDQDSPFATPELDTTLSHHPPAPAPRERRSPRLLAVVLATAVLVVGASVTAALVAGGEEGDGGGAPAPIDWNTDVDAICRNAESRLAPLAGDPSPGAREELVQGGLETLERLRRTTPPTQVESEVEEALARWERAYSELAGGLTREAQGARGAYAMTLGRVRPSIRDANAIARRAGLATCADGVFSLLL